jgi:hypothetical protein
MRRWFRRYTAERRVNVMARKSGIVSKCLIAMAAILALLSAPALAEHADRLGAHHHGGHPHHRANARAIPLCGIYCGGFFPYVGAPAGGIGGTGGIGGAGYSAGYSGWTPGSSLYGSR